MEPFELRNLLPGEYVLAASTNNTPDPATGREEVAFIRILMSSV